MVAFVDDTPTRSTTKVKQSHQMPEAREVPHEVAVKLAIQRGPVTWEHIGAALTFKAPMPAISKLPW